MGWNEILADDRADPTDTYGMGSTLFYIQSSYESEGIV
jgi:hypothetical protein